MTNQQKSINFEAQSHIIMIKLQIIGNLGQDAQTNTLPTGKPVINFSIASTEKYKNESKTTWVKCAYFTERTGLLPYLKKGTKVFVDGSGELETYTDNNGVQRSTIKCVVSFIQLLGGHPEEKPVAQQEDPEEQLETDLPF